MNGFSADGIDGVEVSYSSSVPSRLRTKTHYELTGYARLAIRSFCSNPHSKFAPAQLLCAAQMLGKDVQKNTATSSSVHTIATLAKDFGSTGDLGCDALPRQRWHVDCIAQ
jgi:hypothetical protein